MFQPTVSTKTIARESGRTVSAINAIARDLEITAYNSDLRCWEIPYHLVPVLYDMLEDS